MLYTSDEILLFCEIVRNATPNAIEVYTRGNCGAFALMLNIAFPGGTIKNAQGHRIYEYQGQWYDIEGYSKTTCKYESATDFGDLSVPEILNLLKPRHSDE